MQYPKPVITKFVILVISGGITLDACKTLAQALITSRLDYGNALLCGLPSTLMTRLQKVHNYSARLVTRTHKRKHDFGVHF